VSAKNVTAAVIVQGKFTSRTKNINIAAIYSDDCYYGINCQNQGDNVKVGVIYAYQNYRPVFIYGINGFETTVYCNHNRSTSAAINISRGVGGYDTEAVSIRYIARDQSSTSTHVGISHIDLLGGAISNINLDLDIESSIAYNPVSLFNFDGVGVQTSAASSNVVKNITVRGFVDANSIGISSNGTWLDTTGVINFPSSFSPATNLQSKMDIRKLNPVRQEITFLPTVIGATTAGTGDYTGSGKQIGRCSKVDNVATFSLSVVWIGHTGGAGNTEIGTLPYLSENVTGQITPVMVIQSGGPTPGAGQQRIAYIPANSTRIVLRELNPATNVISNSNTLTTTGSLYISGSYRTA
jgi:hypothetical protein